MLCISDDAIRLQIGDEVFLGIRSKILMVSEIGRRCFASFLKDWSNILHHQFWRDCSCSEAVVPYHPGGLGQILADRSTWGVLYWVSLKDIAASLSISIIAIMTSHVHIRHSSVFNHVNCHVSGVGALSDPGLLNAVELGGIRAGDATHFTLILKHEI